MSSNDNISKPFESVPKLSGKENYVTWKQRLTLALILTRSNSFIDPNTKVPADDSLGTWTDRDSQIAAAILSTTSESILSAHIEHLNDATTELPRSRVIFKALEKLYGTSGPQYSFALGRKFLESRCADQEDVEAWVNQVQAQYRELKLLKFDLDALCINVLLNGLPDRFGSFVDSIWTAEKNPSIEDIKISILRVNAGQLNRSNEKALAARTASLSLDSTTSLTAFYAGLKKSGKKPGKAHPCARCGSPTHWVVDCTKPTDANENSNNNKKKKGKGEQSNETAAPAQAIKTTESSETAAFVSDVVSSFDSNSTEHLFLTSDYSHLSLVARSNRWIIDSGASEHMTGDESLLFDIKALDSTIRIATAGSGHA